MNAREKAAQLMQVDPGDIVGEWDDPRNDCRWFCTADLKVAISFSAMRELEPPRTWQDDVMELAVIMWDAEKKRRRAEEAQ